MHELFHPRIMTSLIRATTYHNIAINKLISEITASCDITLALASLCCWMKHLHACCVCKKCLSDRKKRIPLFEQTVKTINIRKGLVLYFEEEIREDVNDLREAFASDNYMCLDCFKLIEEFPKLRER